MKEERKDEYQRALAAYGDALKSFRQGKTEEAEEQLLAFLEKYGYERELADRARAYLKICQERIGKPKERVNIKSDEDYLLYGVYRLNQGDYESASKLLEKAKDALPKDARAWYLLAELNCLTGQTEECLENLKKAIHLDRLYGTLAQNELSFEPLREDKKFKLITKLS